MQCSQYRIQCVDEVFAMAQRLAEHFAEGDNVIPGIYELLMNAIEHGNLEIGYEHKTQLLASGQWMNEIEYRQSHPRYSDRYVAVTLVIEDGISEVTIADEGAGFDWVRNTLPDDRGGSHGRGLLIAQHIGFASLRFNTAGNVVTCRGLSPHIPVAKLAEQLSVQTVAWSGKQ